LRILKKHLDNERRWLGMAHLAGHSRQYAEGVRMARERVPQLEQALAKLTQPPKADHRKSKTENTTNNQLHLFL